MKRGSIVLARQLCYEIAGATDHTDDWSGGDYGSVDIAEILSAEVVRLREAIRITLADNKNLKRCSGCSSLALTVALRESGVPWDDE